MIWRWWSPCPLKSQYCFGDLLRHWFEGACSLVRSSWFVEMETLIWREVRLRFGLKRRSYVWFWTRFGSVKSWFSDERRPGSTSFTSKCRSWFGKKKKLVVRLRTLNRGGDELVRWEELSSVEKKRRAGWIEEEGIRFGESKKRVGSAEEEGNRFGERKKLVVWSRNSLGVRRIFRFGLVGLTVH